MNAGENRDGIKGKLMRSVLANCRDVGGRRVEDRWRIIDVYLNGTISELALRRSEYSSLIKREGFASLLAALDKRIDDLATGGQSPKAQAD